MSVNKTNKLEKQVKRRIISLCSFLVIVASTLLLVTGCAFNANRIDVNKELSLDENKISFLCLRNLRSVYPDYSCKSQAWSFCDGLVIADGVQEYSLPILKTSIDMYSPELGDDRINIPGMYGSYKHSITLNGTFYGFEGEVGELTYNYNPFEGVFRKSVDIFSDGELIGRVNFSTKLWLSEDYCIKLVENLLIVISVDDLEELPSFTDGIEYIENDIPVIDQDALFCLGIKDVRKWDKCSDIYSYSSDLKGGYRREFWSGYYGRVINTVDITMTIDGNINDTVLHAEFFELKGDLALPLYEFAVNDVPNSDYDRVVNIYLLDELIGKVYYNSQGGMTQDLMSDFLNEFLIYISAFGGNI